MLIGLKRFLLQYFPPLRRFSKSEKEADAQFRRRYIEPSDIVITETFGHRCVNLHPLTDDTPCNPSILPDGKGGFYATARGVNYDSDIIYNLPFEQVRKGTPINSVVLLYRLDGELNIVDARLVDDSELRKLPGTSGGVEDVRLLMWRGELHLAGSAFHFDTFESTYVISKVKDGRLLEPRFIDSPTGRRTEKNWTPIVNGDDLYFLYSYNPWVLFRMGSDGLELESDAVDSYAEFTHSGGSIAVPFRDGFLSVVHRWGYMRRDVRRYVHQLAMLDADMRPIGFGPTFRFEHDGIEFCAGFTLTEDSALFAYGVHDKKAVVLQTSRENLERLLPEGVRQV